MPGFADFLRRLAGGGEQDPERLSAILSLNRELAKAKDRRQLLVRLVDEAVRLFQAERGFVCVPSSSGAGFAVEVARSHDREAVQGPERKLSSTIVRRCMGGEAVFSADAQEGELQAAASVADLKLRSVLAMPLRAGDAVLGCLYLDHRFHGQAFDARDLPWLQAFADQAAIALHLHGLLAQTKEQQARLLDSNRQLSAAVERQQEQLAQALPSRGRADLRHPWPTVFGESPQLCAALAVLDAAVPNPLPVLLWGESGVGKEVVARALHDQGPRRSGPFVAVNLAAITPSLLESELFGHERGAFTGADRARPGLIRQADGGTLLLDEVAEMDLELQARLLRAIEERAVRPVGGDRAIPVDVRVLAATNRDPRQAVQESRLREDLYWRLAVLSVRLPPLRERSGDARLLFQRFLDAAASAQGRPGLEAPPSLLRAVELRAFRGNVRELHNLAQRLCAEAGHGPLPASLPPEPESRGGDEAPAALDLASLERWAIERALAKADGNKAEAARLLGISRRSLYDRLG